MNREDRRVVFGMLAGTCGGFTLGLVGHSFLTWSYVSPERHFEIVTAYEKACDCIVLGGDHGAWGAPPKPASE